MLPMEAAEGFAGIRSTRNANSDGLEPVPIVRTIVLEKFGPLVFRDKLLRRFVIQ